MLAKELGVKPMTLRAWLRAHGDQTQPGISYAFTRKEANAIKKACAEVTVKPAAEPKPEKGRKGADATPPDEVHDDAGESQDVDDDDVEELDDDDVEELDDDA